MDFATLRSRIGRIPWLWSFLAAVALWAAVIVVAHHDPFGTLSADLQIAAFLAVAGLGQLLVIASGNGNIDLSIPNVMTLASLVTLTVADAGHGSSALALLLGLGVGLSVALCNIFAIFILRIPAFVATLAVGLIAQSAVLVEDAQLNQVAPVSAYHFVTSKVIGIPMITVIGVAITLGVAVLLHRTALGRAVFAVGQSRSAAERSGLMPTVTQGACFIMSGLLAATSGMALAAFSGPSISLGDPYLLATVGTVVLGGSLIAGGKGNVTGIWTAALMLNLIVTLVYVLRLSVAWEDIFEGLVIILVLSLGAGTIRVSFRGRPGGAAGAKVEPEPSLESPSPSSTETSE